MKRIGAILFFLFILVACGLGPGTWGYTQQEQIEILTYYPAPYGVYLDLRFDSVLARAAIPGGTSPNTTLYGSNINTHINLGVNCQTGTNGQNYSFCTVSGGGNNTAGGEASAIGGGENNIAYDGWTTIGGGYSNKAGSLDTSTDNNSATVGGGRNNTASGQYSTVAGGGDIVAANGNTASGAYATVGGGTTNTAGRQNSTIGGGNNNNAYDIATTVSGGDSNIAGSNDGNDNAQYATVGGGVTNKAYAYSSTVGGGYDNTVNGQYSTIAGGFTNLTHDYFSAIGGGHCNEAGSNDAADNDQYATVGGGNNNKAQGLASFIGGGSYNTASGDYATVAGGVYNTATANSSFAAGYYAQALHEGCFVWADTSVEGYASDGINQFRVQASGGAYLDGNPWSDIAEHMDVLKEEQVTPGEIVSIKRYDRLGRSTRPYDENIIGVISSDKTTTLNLGASAEPYEDTEKLPVALVGRVFVKVNNENGPIRIGNPITSSSTPGIGMKATKAGKIVGYAMEELNEEQGEILVFVNLTYYVPPEEYLEIKTKISMLEERLSILENKI